MTKEEIGELIAALPEGLDADEFIHRLVNWAVDREREACAVLCETECAQNDGITCAEEIRQRGEK
jgi:hypothetical protein